MKTSVSASPFAPLFQLVAFAFVVAGLFGVQMFLLGGDQPRVNPYFQSIIINAGIAVILAVSLNLINGITGQFSLGHAGFMGVGAYVAAYFTKEIGGQLLDPINFLLGILLGALAAGAAGFVVGLPSLRLRGDYLAIVTLGFNQIIISLIRNIERVGGAAGYSDIPKFTTFVWVFALAVLCIGSVRNLAVSGLGRQMRAVRDDEIAAEASGINTTQVKVIAFVYSAMWAGVAGALQAHYIQTANPNDFNFIRSVEVVVSVVLGGLGSITGSALAAVGLTVLQEQLRSVPVAFYTLVGLVLLALYWSIEKLRAEKRFDVSSFARAVIWPIGFLSILCVVYFYPPSRAFLEANRGALRYIIYSLILIVVMLLRPQGLLGRSEWSFAALRRGRRGAKEVEGGLS